MADFFHFDTPETPTRLYTEFMQKETEEQEHLKSSAMHLATQSLI